MAFDLYIELELPAPVKRVMELLTDERLIRAWSGEDAVMELKEGGAFSMFGGWVKGVVLQYSPEGLSFTWHPEDWDAATPDSVVELRLTAAGPHTLLQLKQGPLPEGMSPASCEAAWYDEVLVPLEDYIMAFE